MDNNMSNAYVIPSNATSDIINAALLNNKVVEFTVGSIYTITKPITLNDNNIVIAYGAIINANIGFIAASLIQGANNIKWFGGVLDGSQLSLPQSNWVGLGIPPGIILSGDGTIKPCNNMVFCDVIMQNCPSGAIFLRQCSYCIFNNVRAINTQTATNIITSGVFEVYGSSVGAITSGGNFNKWYNCTVEGYNWKAWNIGNSIGSSIQACHAYGGNQFVGYAAFFEDGAIDTLWDSISHDGAGFAFKAHNFIRSTLIKPRFNGSAGGVQGQAGIDLKVIGGNYTPPAGVNYALDFEGISGTGSITGIYVDGFTARQTTPVASSSNVGMRILCDSATSATNIKINNCKLDGYYIGIETVNGVGFTYDDISVINSEITNCGNYGVIINSTSGNISNNIITNTATGIPVIALSMIGTGNNGRMKIDNNNLSGATSVSLCQIGDAYGGYTTQWQQLDFTNNVGIGGNSLLSLNFTSNTTDYINSVNINNNSHLNAIAGSTSISATFNTNTTSILHMNNNTLLASNNTLTNISFVNSSSVSIGSTVDGNSAGTISNKPSNAT